MTPKRITLLLGKYGDLLSILPLLYEELLEEDPQWLMVSKQYADLLEGVTYVKPVIFDGGPWEIDRAFQEASKICGEVRCVQVAGPTELVRAYTYHRAHQEKAITGCFEREQWKIAGKIDLWKNQTPLLFDNRSLEREAKLVADVLLSAKNKPVILVSCGGETHPFPYKALLLKLLRLQFSKYRVIDLDAMKAERLYDLLGLYERAFCLVAADSAPLHLAHACPNLPVVALTNDRPSLWHGSAWRANHICYIRYKDFADRATEMLDAITNLQTPFRSKGSVHAFSCYEDVSVEDRTAAQRTWKTSGTIQTPIEIGSIGHDSQMVMKDVKRVPFVKDVIRMASYRANLNDTIVLTRADTHWDAKLSLTQFNPAYSHRIIRETTGDTWHPAVDYFAFTKEWWEANHKDFPSGMYLGHDPFWHRILMEMLKKHGGREVSSVIYKQPSEMKKASHTAYWKENEKLAREWLEKNGITSLFPTVSKQVEARTVNRRALHPFGYNPSIIRHNGRLLMAYRYHPENRFSTRLAMAELDDAFNVTYNGDITGINGISTEDPKLFLNFGQLCISWIDEVWPAENPPCCVRYGVLEKKETWQIVDQRWPQYGKNDGTAMEKNFVFFEL